MSQNQETACGAFESKEELTPQKYNSFLHGSIRDLHRAAVDSKVARVQRLATVVGVSSIDGSAWEV